MTFTNGFDYVYFSEVKFLQVYDRKFIVLDHNDTSNARVYDYMCVYFYLNDHIHLMCFTSF